MDFSTNSLTDSGQITDTLFWELFEDGLLRISGEGDMPDWGPNTLERRPWNVSAANIRRLEAAEGLTRVGSCAFFGMPNLASVTLPASLCRVSYQAFRACPSLTDVTFSAFPMKEASEEASPGRDLPFEFCYEKNLSSDILRKLRFGLPENTKKIPAPESDYTFFFSKEKNLIFLGQHAFSETPWGIRTIGTFLYRGDVLLEYLGGDSHVDIPYGTRRIHDFAFAGSPLSEVSFPDSLEEIGAYAFNRTHISDVLFPWHIKRIERGAFSAISEFSSGTWQHSRLKDVFVDPDAFTGSAASRPDLRPGKNHRYYLQPEPYDPEKQVYRLRIARKEKYVGVDRILLHNEMYLHLKKNNFLVQVLWRPKRRQKVIYQVTCLCLADEKRIVMSHLIVRPDWSFDIVFPYGGSDSWREPRLDLSRSFPCSDAIRLQKGARLWCSHYFLPDQPHTAFREEWFLIPSPTTAKQVTYPWYKTYALESMKKCANAWLEQNPEYKLAV